MDGMDARMALDLESVPSGGSPTPNADIVLSGTEREFAELSALAAAAGLSVRLARRLEAGEAPRVALAGERVEDSLRAIALLGIPHGAAVVIHGGGDRWPTEPFGIVPSESPSAVMRAMEGMLLDLEARRPRRAEYALRDVDHEASLERKLSRATLSAAVPEGGRGFDHRAANAAPRSHRRHR